MPVFTDDQIQTLAPDAASLKAGKALANAHKWPTLAYSDRALWGQVQGSGKDPYRTQVDLINTAFNCSCPSRKFPCKHGLGLLQLYVHEPNLFITADEPVWVSSWMDKRVEKAVKETKQKTVTGETAKADIDQKTKNQEKRTADRLNSVLAGVVELDRWLKDLVRTGLLAMPEKESSYWQNMASRMIDAKAPGLANRVKQLSQLAYFDGNVWQQDALRQIGQLHLLTQAFERLEQLPPDLQADVKANVGLTIQQEELIQSPTADTLTDHFWVLARQTMVEEELTIQRNYLYAQQSGRFAYILNFAYKNVPIPTVFVPGTQAKATVVFYPGRWPYRAVLKSQETGHSETSFQKPIGYSDWSAAQQGLTDVLNQSPWADQVPQLVGPLTLHTANSRRYLRDQTGLSQPITSTWPDSSFYKWLAFSGGHPVMAFVLRSEKAILPLAIWTDSTYHIL